MTRSLVVGVSFGVLTSFRPLAWGEPVHACEFMYSSVVWTPQVVLQCWTDSTYGSAKRATAEILEAQWDDYTLQNQVNTEATDWATLDVELNTVMMAKSKDQSEAFLFTKGQHWISCLIFQLELATH